MWAAHEAGAGTDFLREVYPGLQRLYDYCWEARAVEPAGLFTGGFLGMDNLPRGPGLAQADASGWMAFFARYLGKFAETFGDGAAAARYTADVEKIVAAVNATLWNEGAGFYFDLDRDGFLPTKSYSGLIPLIAGIAPADRAERVLAAVRDSSRSRACCGRSGAGEAAAQAPRPGLSTIPPNPYDRASSRVWSRPPPRRRDEREGMSWPVSIDSGLSAWRPPWSSPFLPARGVRPPLRLPAGAQGGPPWTSRSPNGR